MKSSKDPRHNARRVAMCALFCELYGEQSVSESLPVSQELLELPEEKVDKNLTNSIINGIKVNRKEIDGIITQCAPDWPLEKISKTDLVILRMAIFEILHSEEVPDKVVIDEAVELSKEFGGDTSSKFVNGVLGTVVDIKIEASELDENAVKEPSEPEAMSIV